MSATCLRIALKKNLVAVYSYYYFKSSFFNVQVKVGDCFNIIYQR